LRECIFFPQTFTHNLIHVFVSFHFENKFFNLINVSLTLKSRMGGIVLEQAVGNFSGFVVFQPIINGIGGNLVSVQASKISTMLHQSSLPGLIPPHAKIFELPWRALFHGTPYAKTARILILMSIPGQVLFIFVADYIHMRRSTIGAPFIAAYLLVSLVQVIFLNS
jgi:solute carrier family 41